MVDNIKLMVIVAMTPDGIIGMKSENRIPWKRIPEDLQWFRSMTHGSVVVMGRRTFESLPGSKPLEGRMNIVMTTNKTAIGKYDNLIVVDSYEQMIKKISEIGRDVFVIGGGEIYKLLLPLCKRIFVTIVFENICCDPNDAIYFPLNLDELKKKYFLLSHSPILTSSSSSDITYRFMEFITTTDIPMKIADAENDECNLELYLSQSSEDASLGT